MKYKLLKNNQENTIQLLESFENNIYTVAIESDSGEDNVMISFNSKEEAEEVFCNILKSNKITIEKIKDKINPNISDFEKILNIVKNNLSKDEPWIKVGSIKVQDIYNHGVGIKVETENKVNNTRSVFYTSIPFENLK